MKTIVLDDDPTGTQSASDVTVLFDPDRDGLIDALRTSDSVYVQTNSRALNAEAAVALVRRLKSDGEAAGAELGAPVRFVLRGDSTLRGHVFAETEVFLTPDSVMVFVPAFPDGGRTTEDGVHYVQVAGEKVPAAQTEYADDPVFPFHSSDLAEYVRDKSGREAVPVPLDEVRGGGLGRLIELAPPNSVVVPDAVDAADISRIAEAVVAAEQAGRHVVVRTAAPLAAELAGVVSTRFLTTPLADAERPVLLVCGSHTAGAGAQLARVLERGAGATTVTTELALRDPAEAAGLAAAQAAPELRGGDLAVLMTERTRAAEHNTLDHGERVMAALTGAVSRLLPHAGTIVAKGGITSAEVARSGIGASTAHVLGQIAPGISAWRLTGADGRERTYIVVPGNVGDEDTLVLVLAAVGVPLR